MRLQFPICRAIRLRITLKSGAQITIPVKSYNFGFSQSGEVTKFSRVSAGRPVLATVAIDEIAAVERLRDGWLPRWRRFFW